jgi:hypothetical protein
MWRLFFWRPPRIGAQKVFTRYPPTYPDQKEKYGKKSP